MGDLLEQGDGVGYELFLSQGEELPLLSSQEHLGSPAETDTTSDPITSCTGHVTLTWLLNVCHTCTHVSLDRATIVFVQSVFASLHQHGSS